MTMSPHQRRSTVQVVVGLLIITWGTLALLANLHFITPHFVRWLFGLWPLLLALFGFGKMMTSDTVPGRVLGGFLGIVGLAWTAEHLFQINIRLWQWWPLILIGLGAMLVARAWEPSGADGAGVARPSGREFAMFSGLQRRITTPEYRGTELTTIMGGAELDLRGSATATGEAVIDLFVVLGGVQIKVPPDWAVVNQVTPIAGGIEDRSTGGPAAQHRLIVRGQVIVGGIEIGT